MRAPVLNTNGLEDRAQATEEITFLAERLSSLLLLHLLLIASPRTHIAKMQKCLWFCYIENQWLVGLPVSLPLSLFCSAEDEGGMGGDNGMWATSRLPPVPYCSQAESGFHICKWLLEEKKKTKNM